MQKQASSTSSLLGTNTLLAAQLQQQLLGLAMSSSGRQLQLSSGITGSPDLPGDLPTMLSMDGFSDSSGSLTTASSAVLGQQPPVLGPPHGVGPGGASSLYIKGMPEDADKLWLYEKFARFGGINSVRVLIDEQTGKCNGIGFVNYVTADAARLAQETMNGVSMGDRLLHVMVQNPATRSRSAPAGSAVQTVAAAAPTLPLGQPGSAGLPSMRPQGLHSVHNLGLHPSTLATLQAGLLPSATGPMLPNVANGLPLNMRSPAFGGMSAQPAPAAFGQVQW
jgi:hypothetical protein